MNELEIKILESMNVLVKAVEAQKAEILCFDAVMSAIIAHERLERPDGKQWLAQIREVAVSGLEPMRHQPIAGAALERIDALLGTIASGTGGSEVN